MPDAVENLQRLRGGSANSSLTSPVVALASKIEAEGDLVYLSASDMGAIIEIENIVCLAACSLDTHPGKSNWV